MYSLWRHITIASIFVVFISYQIAICSDLTSIKGDLEVFSSLPDYKKQEQIKLIICSQTSDNQRRNFKSLEDLNAEVPRKLDLGNPYIADTAMNIAKDYPGEYSINQVCAIYDAMAGGGWYYYSEANDVDYFHNANLTLQRGKISNTIGRGDCDDFAILMASLIESLGGSTRIIFAFDQLNKNAHAYTEVYLGKVDDPHVAELEDWLRDEYPGENFSGINVTGGSKWLNLDWGASHPGGPYFGNDSSFLWQAIIRESPIKTSPEVVPMIDPMESTARWETIKDDEGSLINISTIPGKKGFAMEITYNLMERGWVGISKYIDSMAFSEANGINLSYFSIGAGNSMDIRMACEDGTTFGVSWTQPKREIWSYRKALYSDFRCLSPEGGCQGYDNHLNKNKIRKIELIISNNPENGNVPGSGKVIIDQIQGIMAIDKGSAWSRAERDRKKGVALRLASKSEETLEQPELLTRSVLLAAEALQHYPCAEANSAMRSGLALLPKMTAILPHEDEVWKVIFAPDGLRLATASDDGTARIWNASTGRELVRVEHDEWGINDIAFSLDGLRLATAGSDDTVRIWDAHTGKELAKMIHEDTVNAVVFNRGGTMLATASGDSTARIWDATTGQELARMVHEDWVNELAFSPDGTRLATASEDKTARIWDITTGRELARMEHGGEEWGGVYDVAFSPDGTRLATGSEDGTARIWDANTGQELARLYHGERFSKTEWMSTVAYTINGSAIENVLVGESIAVKEVVFSSDGTRLATASDDGTARVWDAITGRELTKFEHESGIVAVTFSPDDTKIATASDDGTARIWNARTGSELSRMEHEHWVYDVAFSPDGSKVATASDDNMARIWDVKAGREKVGLKHDSWLYDVDFSPDGTRLATGSEDHTARIWDAATGQELARMEHEDGVRAVAFSPEGTMLASASYDGTAGVWEAGTGKELARLKHNDTVWAVAFSPDGKKLATASFDGTARTWDTKTWQELTRMKHEDGLRAADFSPDGTQLATACDDKTARIWDVATGQEMVRMEHDRMVYNAIFSPDGIRLATASQDGTSRIWDVATGKELVRMKHDKWEINDIAFSPDGTRVATAGSDCTVRIWDAITGKELAKANCEDNVEVVAFSPDGTRLATASRDSKARILDAITGNELAIMDHEYWVNDVTFSPDGSRLATASEGDTAFVWLWRLEDLIAEACSRLNRNLTQDEWRQYLGDEPYRETCPCRDCTPRGGR